MNLFRGELRRCVGVRRRRTIVLPQPDNSPVQSRQNKESRHRCVTETGAKNAVFERDRVTRVMSANHRSAIERIGLFEVGVS